MSDTPRTDAAAMPIDRVNTFASRPCNVVHEDVCRKLERELAEAKFDLQFRRDLYALQSKELAEAREQRDELAEALEMVATHTYADGQCDNGYSPQYVAKQALAAMKGGADD
jgi:hypothetical protein